MDKPFVIVGSVVAALVVGYGVGSAATPAVNVVVNVPGSVPGNVPGAPPLSPTSRLAPSPGKPAFPPPAPAAGKDVTPWETLTGYEYRTGMEGLTDPVKALEGKTVTMRGFLAPLYEFDDIHEFMLVPNHMSCCFGIPPGLNGQVYVHLKSERGLPNTNEPIEVKGVFHAREKSEQGYILSIYELVDATGRVVGY